MGMGVGMVRTDFGPANPKVVILSNINAGRRLWPLLAAGSRLCRSSVAGLILANRLMGS